MSSLKCKKCGKYTSTSVSEFMDTWPDAEICYASMNLKKGVWVKGCGYKKAAPTDKKIADRLIGRSASLSGPPQVMGKTGKNQQENDE